MDRSLLAPLLAPHRGAPHRGAPHRGRVLASAALALALASTACNNGEVVWPIANSADADADYVSAPWGPRDQSGDYDFHAGVDFPVPEGTKVRAIKAGVVEKTVEWDGKGGTGTWILIDHGDGEKSSYLHLSKISVSQGKEVRAGKVIGRSGSTGNTSPHLHLTYMLGVEHDGSDEALSHNPLELLPHDPMPEPMVEWTETELRLDMVLQPMTVQTITLEGGGVSSTVDYADIVARGNPDRDNKKQNGIRLDVPEETDERFVMTLRMDPADAPPDHVVLTSFDGEIILDASRP